MIFLDIFRCFQTIIKWIQGDTTDSNNNKVTKPKLSTVTVVDIDHLTAFFFLWIFNYLTCPLKMGFYVRIKEG